MPTLYTDNLNLSLPEVGASRDSWGSLLNDNFTALDGASLPIGSVLDFAGPNAPPGWLICNGRNVSRITYSDLFAVLGTYWGAGDGTTTFTLPNTAGRSIVGAGTVTDSNGNNVAFSFGQLTGVVLQQIQQANLPAVSITTNTVLAHSHGSSTGNAGSHNHLMNVAAAADGGTPAAIAAPTSDTSAQGVPTGYVGDHAHGIVPDGSHSHTFTLGNGSSFSVQNPVAVMTKIIFAGTQALPSTLAAAATPQRRVPVTPLRGNH